jgi:hypothetical protein
MNFDDNDNKRRQQLLPTDMLRGGVTPKDSEHSGREDRRLLRKILVARISPSGVCVIAGRMWYCETTSVREMILW